MFLFETVRMIRFCSFGFLAAIILCLAVMACERTATKSAE